LPSPAHRGKAKSLKTKPPPEPKSWDQRIAQRGDDSERTTFAAVGEALSRWTRFELNLARLFATLTMADEKSMIGPVLAFGSVRTFEGRIEMVHASGSWFFSVYKALSASSNDAECGANAIVKLQERFERLYKNGKNFVARRNEIAHGIVSPQPIAKIRKHTYVQLKRPRFAFVPAYIEMSKHTLFSQPKFIYGSKELLSYAGEFVKLADEARSLDVSIHAMLLERQKASLSP
jgi:hypothetical protein